MDSMTWVVQLVVQGGALGVLIVVLIWISRFVNRLTSEMTAALHEITKSMQAMRLEIERQHSDTIREATTLAQQNRHAYANQQQVTVDRLERISEELVETRREVLVALNDAKRELNTAISETKNTLIVAVQNNRPSSKP